MARSNFYSTLTEKELFELLIHVLSGTSEDHKHKRINGLGELQRRIKSNSILNINGSIDVLLEMAKKQGHSRPESSLIVNSLLLLVNKYEEAFQTVLGGLEGQGQEEDFVFSVFSKLVLGLDYERKRQAIKPLVQFLVSRENVHRFGVREVFDCLSSLSIERLSIEVVEEISPYLDSFGTCAIVFSVKLCSKFADHRVLPKMLEVLGKSMKGYFPEIDVEIERDLCAFFKRVRDESSLFPLMELLKIRYRQSFVPISEAIASILNAHPYRVDDVFDMLYDERHEEKLVNAILYSLKEINEQKLDARKLLSNIRMDYWGKSPAQFYVHDILVKLGEGAKPILFEILKDEQKYDFALRCLKEIGISREELSKLFPKPVMLQVYEFLYSQKRGKRIPKDLNQLWEDKKKLQENVPGTTNWLEHLLLHIFASFNFVTLNVAPLKSESVDLVCFHPETLDLFIVGCTTGILKDDLAKMDALITRMEEQIPNLFGVCSITPIVVCSEVAAISPSDKKYSAEQGIVVMQRHHIDEMLEMLNTNRKPRQAIKYIEDCKISQLGALDVGS